ncbi:MAG: hypothetical protein IIA88_04870 [Bacteroidetes bacterium]|nr:hypothetical protein [Bacteroidota bacterium]
MGIEGYTDIQTRRNNDPDLSTQKQKAYDDEIIKVNKESAKNITISAERSIFERESEFKGSILMAKNEAFVRKQIIEKQWITVDDLITWIDIKIVRVKKRTQPKKYFHL